MVPTSLFLEGRIRAYDRFSSLNYFNDDFVGAGVAFDLDRHANPFLCLFFDCDS